MAIEGVEPGESLMLYRRSHRAAQLSRLVDRLMDRYEDVNWTQSGVVGQLVERYRARIIRVLEAISRRT